MNNRGLALIATLLAIILMSALIAAGLWASQTSTRTSVADAEYLKAFYAAEGASELGLTYLPGQATVQTTINEIATTTEITMLRPRLYQVHGIADGVTVEHLVRFIPAGWPVPAAMSTNGTVQINGAAATIDGRDRCGNDTIAGIAAFEVNGNGMVLGDPPISTTPDLDSLLVEFSALPADYTLDDATPWPILAADEWPVIRVTNGVALSSGQSGRGTLIVDGQLTVNGGWTWDGIVVVLGEFTSNGNTTLNGALIVGRPGNPEELQLNNGVKNLKFDSCALEQAALGAGKETRLEVLRWLEL